MKKFLSIKNSQGIYVARASFSSNETVIDFANNNSNTNNSNNTKPVSIVVTPGQASSTSSLPIAAVVCEPDDSGDTRLIRANQLCIGSQTGSELSLVSKASSSKKKRFSKVLRVLHLKGKSKMGDHTKEAKSKRATESPTSSGSTQSLPKPEKIGKGRTAALVKKFSITSKKSTSSGPSDKKSSIPLRKATSGETFPNVKQKSHGNLELVTTATSEIISTATTTTYSSSEMNLVNIDYRQESTDDLNVGIKLGQTDYQNYSSNRSDKIGGSGGGSGNLSRAWNTSSNLSTSVDKNRIGGVRGGSSEKLQITISGKKRNSTEYLSDLQHKQQQQQQQQQPQQFENVEQKKLERKTLAMQPNKVNISHDLTLMNTVGVPTSATQIPSMPSSYRITTGSIKKVVQSGAGIKRQSTMQSKQTFDVSASTVAAESSKANVPPASEPMTSASALGNIVVTSFDADETEEIAANLLKEQDEDDKETTSLLNEINEAERRNSMSMDRGRRFPGVAASEAIKFSHQPTDAAPAPPTTTTSDATVEAKRQPPPIPISVVPKVIINQPTLAESDSLPVQSDKKAKSVKTETVNESENENENDLMQSLSSSTGAKLLQEATDDGNDVGKTVGDAPPSPSLQFEVGKQVRPIFTSNQTLHHIGYSALDIDPPTAFTSIMSSSSFIQNFPSSPALDTHNQSFASNASGAYVDDANVSVNNAKIKSNDHEHRTQNHSRRRIAYIESSAVNAVSPSTSNSTLNTEDDDLLAENRLDSTLTQLSTLHTSNTFITDFFMPPYGDLVLDGVIEISKSHFSVIISTKHF